MASVQPCTHCGAVPPDPPRCCYETQLDSYEMDYDESGGVDGLDDYDEPIGSCEWCDVNIYDDEFDGLCERCAWLAEH